MGLLDNLGLSGLGNSLSSFGKNLSNLGTNIDDQTGGLLTRLGQPDNQANLITAASLLSGEGIPASFALRNQVRSNLLANQQFKRQREGIEALKKRFANNPRILALIDANPTAVMNAITAQAFTPVDNFKILTQAEKEQLGIKGDGVFQKNTRTGAITAVGSPKTIFNVGGQGNNLDNTEFYKDLQKQSGEFLDTYGNMIGNINNLRGALETLKTDENISGLAQGITQFFGGDPALKLIFPNTANTKARIESVVQESLRSIIGSQFTEREGENILARAFDPAVSPQENARRLEVILNKIELGFEAKKRYFDAFTKGEKPPPLPTLRSLGLDGGTSDATSTFQRIPENTKNILRQNKPEGVSVEQWNNMLENLSIEEIEPLLR